ncbi:LysR family transcriptional regulator [Rheinheimera sp. SA_1]|uniref:LysR family transcriptional regulator n=1 Tax=Rheinheimera sp. SA_1 TaxID=1827365 RepID=UPI000A6CEF51|nr:LysR family transcriptional regulator [Rheinheimera sp. SA_1]
MSLLQRLSDMAIFAKVVESGSFTQAAAALTMSKGAASKAIARLEQHLAVRLLQRTTRQLKLTAEGQAFLSYCQQVVRQADQAEHHLAELRDEPVGSLRISVAITYGGTVIAPLLPEFLQRHPKLQVELVLEDRLVDLVGDEVDVAVRFGKLANSSLIARPLTRLPIVLVASPCYLATHGIPQHPNDLANHRCISTASSGPEKFWEFLEQGKTITVPTRGPLHTNSNRAAKPAVLNGMGLMFVTRYQVEEEIQAGLLVPVLTDYMPAPLPVHLVYPHRTHMKAGLKLLLQYLQCRIGQS